MNQRAQDVLNEADALAETEYPHENDMDNNIRHKVRIEYLLARLIGTLEWIGESLQR